MKLRYLVSTALTTSAMFAFQTPAHAQAADAASNDGNEIVVTATKREENLQNVPISIQALGTEKLEQNQVSSFDDYAKLLPSVSFQSFGPGQSQLYFRGISSGGDGLHGGSQPATGLYLDEIPVTTIATSVDLHIYDIARVEALAGPQGTLFGSASLSGTLRLITNKPDPTRFSAAFDLQGNKFGKGGYGGSFEGYVNIPLSERAALRVVGFYQHDAGYIDNIPGSRTYTLGDLDPATNVTVNNNKLAKKDFNDTDTYGGRAALKVDLDDNWTATATGIYQHQVAHGSFLYDPRFGDLNVTQYVPSFNKDRWFQAAMTIEGKLGDWDLTYTGGYFERKTENQSDYSEYTVAYDAIPGGYYTYFQTPSGGFLDPTQLVTGSDKYTKQTHDFRVTSPSSDRFRLVAGFFYQRQTDKIRADYIIPGLGTSPSAKVVPTTKDDLFMTDIYRVDRDYAAYGEASYDLLDKLTLTAGIRFFVARNSLIGFSGFAAGADNSIVRPGKPICIPTKETTRPCDIVYGLGGSGPRFVDQSGETHKVNMTYHFDPDHMIYATYSTGFRPGGINRKSAVGAYRPDTLTNYEIGLKTSWFGRRLRLNAAFFIEDWKDIQFGLTSVGDQGVTSTYNAGNARVKGVEGDFSLRVSHGLTLSGSGTYVDPKLTTDFCTIDATGAVRFQNCALGIAAPKGSRLPVQPKVKGNMAARYEFAIGNVDSFVQGTLNYQSGTRSYLTTIEANLLGNTSAFTTFDFSLGGKTGNWTFEAFVQNAFDKRGILSINTFCAPTICGAAKQFYPIKPQQFGVKVGTKF
jgi:outer membrane receptor protein involved in Fe transport